MGPKGMNFHLEKLEKKIQKNWLGWGDFHFCSGRVVDIMNRETVFRIVFYYFLYNVSYKILYENSKKTQYPVLENPALENCV